MQSTITPLYSMSIATPLGPMLAIADDSGLYLLEFADQPSLAREMAFLKKSLKTDIISGTSSILNKIESEIKNYFENKNDRFKTPYYLMGSAFQKSVWQQLIHIPLGETQSYGGVAKSLNYPTAYRAVANANSTNRLAIMIPCHRVIHSNGQLGGYAGGIARKKWLLAHEKN